MAGRRIKIDDLYNIKLVADPNISPDGRHLAYVVTDVDPERNDYSSAIWMAEVNGSSEPIQFTMGRTKDHSPRWSPDGEYLAFISDRNGKSQIYVMPTNGGEPWQVTNGPNPAEGLRWAADGKSILFVTRDEAEIEPESDSRVITTLIYKSDGVGFINPNRRQIHTVSRDGSETQQLTTGDWHSTSPVLSPDGSKLAFVSNRTHDRDDNTKSAIWITDLATNEEMSISGEDGVYTAPAWDPSGEKLAFTGYPISDEYGPSTLSDLYVWDAASGEVSRLLDGSDREPANSIIADSRYHVPNHEPRWSSTGDTLYSLVSDAGNVELWACSLDGSREVAAGGSRDIQSFSVSDHDVVAVASSTPTTPTDVCIITNDGRERQITAVNKRLLDDLELSEIEEIQFESDPGVVVHGWLMRPPGMNSQSKHPAIVQVHGGPHGMYGTAFFHEMQVLAARGYVILMTNPRGSSGYGQEWVARTHGDWGGVDYRDVMAGADALAALDYVDSSRMGITGGSYGGYMTNWVIGQTDRFKAAVSQRSTANRTSLYGTSDINMTYNDWEYSGAPYDNPDHYRERSPLTYAKNVTTPLLLLHSENDLRCPISQSEEFYTALKKLGKTVEFVRFPDESHGMSRSGQPVHRVERLERICAWFDTYL